MWIGTVSKTKCDSPRRIVDRLDWARLFIKEMVARKPSPASSLVFDCYLFLEPEPGRLRCPRRRDRCLRRDLKLEYSYFAVGWIAPIRPIHEESPSQCTGPLSTGRWFPRESIPKSILNGNRIQRWNMDKRLFRSISLSFLPKTTPTLCNLIKYPINLQKCSKITIQLGWTFHLTIIKGELLYKPFSVINAG